jgi:hypothetical protein
MKWSEIKRGKHKERESEREKAFSADNIIWKQSSKLGDVRINATSTFFVLAVKIIRMT